METEPEIVYSPQNRRITDPDGVRAIEIYIYRDASKLEWVLEVVNHLDHSYVWEDLFDSDLEAWDEFQRAFKEDGMDVFYQPAEEDEDD